MQQPRLFEYTRTSELLTGMDVIKIATVKRTIRSLQQQKTMVPNESLDRYDRNGMDATSLTVVPVETGSQAYTYSRVAIAVKIQPKALRSYMAPVVFLWTKTEAKALLETVQAYLYL